MFVLQNVKSVKQVDIKGTTAYVYRTRSRSSSTGSLWIVTTIRDGQEVLLASQLNQMSAMAQATRQVKRGTFIDAITRNYERID